MKRLLIALGVIAAVIGFVFLFYSCGSRQPEPRVQHIEVDFTISCVECHSSTSPEVVEAWQEGKHGEYDHGCQICHGVSASDFKARPRASICRRCHKQRISVSRTCARSCFDCHDGHSLKFHG